MSKSRSNDDKGKDKDKDAEKDKENERENQNEDTDAEDSAEGNSVQQHSMDQRQLTNGANCDLMSPAVDSNSLMVRNESAIRSSPPPSYEHVIEQTRLEHVAEIHKQENAEMAKRQRRRIAEEERNNSGGTAIGADYRPAPKGPEILHKSSKEFYRAMAKQWGITCKMSDHCRCFDCQSRYFDCEYEQNDHQKSDGGLGAGTPMFISEVIHGTACALL